MEDTNASGKEPTGPFQDRKDAGRQLAERLHQYRDVDPLVVGVPRGGLPVAAEIARRLQAQLDIVFTKKLGAPGNPELAIGAVGESGVTYLNQDVIGEMGISEDYVKEERARKMEENQQRTEEYRNVKPRVEVGDRTVILVDDGVATGATLLACIRILQTEEPGRLILAIPVAPVDILPKLERETDEVICLRAVPGYFGGISAYYRNFGQTSDEEVLSILEEFSGEPNSQ